MSYQSHKTNRELNQQLLIGIKKHLLIAQNTSEPKQTRLTSLRNIGEVLEYVLDNMNDAIPAEEHAICFRFFTILLVKVKHAEINIHQTPSSFNDEIGFISVLLKI